MKKLALMVCILVAAVSFYFSAQAAVPSADSAKLDVKCGKLEGILQLEDHEYSYWVDNQNVIVKYAKESDEKKHIDLATAAAVNDSVCVGQKIDQKTEKSTATPVFTVGKTVEEAQKAITL